MTGPPSRLPPATPPTLRPATAAAPPPPAGSVAVPRTPRGLPPRGRHRPTGSGLRPRRSGSRSAGRPAGAGLAGGAGDDARGKPWLEGESLSTGEGHGAGGPPPPHVPLPASPAGAGVRGSARRPAARPSRRCRAGRAELLDEPSSDGTDGSAAAPSPGALPARRRSPRAALDGSCCHALATPNPGTPRVAGRPRRRGAAKRCGGPGVRRSRNAPQRHCGTGVARGREPPGELTRPKVERWGPGRGGRRGRRRAFTG